MRTGMKRLITGAILFLLLLLAGCSREYMDARREIDRIYKAAEKSAEDRAAAYISKKYGIDAVPQGHWVQAHYDFFTSYKNPNVVVFMEGGDRKFCVGVHAYDQSVLWDNYQREEIDSVLQDYLTDLYALPQPYGIKTVYRLSSAPSYNAVVPLEWRERGYDHANMVNFYFSGQPPEELFAQMEHLEYHVSYLSLDRPLDAIGMKPEDWPIGEDGSVEWHLRRYTSPEARFVDIDERHPDIAAYPYLLQWRHVLLKHRGTGEQELSDGFVEFHSAQQEGITFAAKLPFEVEEILLAGKGDGEWTVDSQNGGTQAYSLISSLYEVTEPSPDSYYIAAMSVPAALAEQYENPLYILSRNRETGRIRVEARVLSREELQSIPDADQRKNYKIHANGIHGMSAGYQYAVAEKIERSEPDSPDGFGGRETE